MTLNEETMEDESWADDLDSEDTVDEDYVSPLASGLLESEDEEEIVFDEDSEDQPLEGVVVEDSEAGTDLAELDEPKPLSVEEAKELTEHIRSTADVLYVLVARAHAGKAHLALGYKNFESYVKEEFNISRSRAYQFLNQANVIAAIEAAAPEGTKIRITEAAARDLKNFVDELAPAIKERTEGLNPDEAGDVVEEMVDIFRDKSKNPTPAEDESFNIDDIDLDDVDIDLPEFGDNDNGSSSGGGSEFDSMEDFGNLDGILDDPVASNGSDDPSAFRKTVENVYAFYSSLTALQKMPDVKEILDAIPDTRYSHIDSGLPKALEWLTLANEEWEARKADRGGDVVTAEDALEEETWEDSSDDEEIDFSEFEDDRKDEE